MVGANAHNPERSGADNLLDELFPVITSTNRRRQRVRCPDISSPEKVPTLEDDTQGCLTRRSNDHLVGVGCAVLAIAVRLVFAHFIGASDLHRLGLVEVGIGGVLVMLTTWLCSRAGVSIVVCLALTCAIATLDIAAPVGIAIVLAAVLATRRRSR